MGRAKEFNENLYDPVANENGFDGLICAVSAHGINRSILTSDYGLVEKKTVYRKFTDKFVESRQFPRVFIFDCCDGTQRMSKSIKRRRKNDEKETTVTVTKGDGEIGDKDSLWKRGDDNTDWLLAVINSSNPDYVSGMNAKNGSHLIFSFYVDAIQCLDNHHSIYLGQIFNKIQQELGKVAQLPVYLWNNGTEHIKLKKNKMQIAQSNEEMMVEMIETQGNDDLILEEGDGGNDDTPQNDIE